MNLNKLYIRKRIILNSDLLWPWMNFEVKIYFIKTLRLYKVIINTKFWQDKILNEKR